MNLLAEKQGYACYQHSPLIPTGAVSQGASTVAQTVSGGGNSGRPAHTQPTEGAGPGRVTFALHVHSPQEGEEGGVCLSNKN